ncbi:MAG: diguanylate cyclase [Actinomycetota bacterium]
MLRYMPGSCMLLNDGVVVGANPDAVETLGIPLGRLIGVPFTEFVLIDHQNAMQRTLAETEPGSATVQLRLAAGLRPVELTLRRLPDRVAVVGVRSTRVEHHYSAQARGDLTHDPLTGLSNRYHLLEQLQERMTARTRSPLAIVGLWVDELPTLADTRGQRVVDRVIKDVGQRLEGRLRGPDVIGRFEPAGFITVLTSDASVAQLTEIAGRLRDEVAFPVELDAGLVSFTASVVVGALAKRNIDIERILHQLDDAAERLSQGPGDTTEVLEL